MLYPALDRLGIARSPRQTGFHCFRHSAGSVVQEKTKNMKAAQSLLRHASYSTTADIYVHVSDEVQEEAAQAERRYRKCLRDKLAVGRRLLI